MIIDIQRTILRKNLRAFILALVFIFIIVILLLTSFYEDQLFGLTSYHLAIIIAGIYLLFMVYNTLRQYNYIYFSYSGDKLVLRYFSTGVFTHRKNSIEISRNDFAGYEKKTALFGFREKVILKVKTPRGIAKYPPVSFTALSRKEKRDIYSVLEMLKK
jgi:hypothetical protein